MVVRRFAGRDRHGHGQGQCEVVAWFPVQSKRDILRGERPCHAGAVIGGYFHDKPELLRRFVLASTRLTHTDPKAAIGAEAVARVAAWAVEHDPALPPDAGAIAALLAVLAPHDSVWCRWIEEMEAAIATKTSVSDYPWLAVLPRNLLFLLVVLFHGFRRLAPPY